MSNKVPADYRQLVFNTILISHLPLPASAPPNLLKQAVTTITLNRPSRLNAFTYEMALEIEAAFNILSKDDRVRVIVITGAGRAFCAGADLNAGVLDTTKPPQDHRDEGGMVALSIFRCKKPVIAAINGAAVGIGITLALPCTIRITHASAKIAFPFVRRGIVPEATSSFFLPKLIGYSRALHLLTTGETVLGNDKLVDGLFSEVVDRPDQVLWRAYDIAEKIAVHSSAVSAYLVEAMVWHVPNSPEETHLLDSRIMAELYRGADKKDGIDSFLEKRTPIFRDTVTENLPSIVPWWKTVKTKVPLVKGKL